MIGKRVMGSMMGRRRRAAAVLTIGALTPLAAVLPALADSNPSVSVSPSTVTESDSGGVSFALDGSSFPAKIAVTINSPGLDSACSSNTLSGQTATADYDGNFNTSATGTGCAPGTYNIEVSEQSTPYQTYSATLTIDAPGQSSSSTTTSTTTSTTSTTTPTILGLPGGLSIPRGPNLVPRR